MTVYGIPLSLEIFEFLRLLILSWFMDARATLDKSWTIYNLIAKKKRHPYRMPLILVSLLHVSSNRLSVTNTSAVFVFIRNMDLVCTIIQLCQQTNLFQKDLQYTNTKYPYCFFLRKIYELQNIPKTNKGRMLPICLF